MRNGEFPNYSRIRLTRGNEGIDWKLVIVDAMQPRTLLDTLTGRYRRLPALQVGVDIYCDT